MRFWLNLIFDSFYDLLEFGENGTEDSVFFWLSGRFGAEVERYAACRGKKFSVRKVRGKKISGIFFPLTQFWQNSVFFLISTTLKSK